MKKVIRTVLMFALILTLSACGQAPEADFISGDASTVPSPPSQEFGDNRSEESSSSTVESDTGEQTERSSEAGGTLTEASSSESKSRAEASGISEAASPAGSIPIEPSDTQNSITPEADGMFLIAVTVGSDTFTARLYDNESVKVLIDNMPMALQLEDYANQEKVTELPYDFPSASTQTPATIRTGELYLWSGNSLVLFYTSFSNSYSYVPVGYIEDATGLAAALGSGSVSVTFCIA